MVVNIGLLAFDGITQLDLTGPMQVLARAPNSVIHVVAKTERVSTDVAGFFLHATVLLQACPQLDVLVVPGGLGVDAAMLDDVLVSWVRTQAASARYVGSVCTGMFILGAAGLLKGKRATTHWAYHHLLHLTGAIPVHERVVRDGNLFTGGGVTAGIDFGLTLLAELADATHAEAVQRALEYDPQPPFPRRAGPAAQAVADKRYETRLVQFEAQLRKQFEQ